MVKNKVISCQLTYHPLTADYLSAIERLLNDFDPGPLKVEIGTMSTVLIGPEDVLWRKIQELYATAAQQDLPFIMEFSLSNCCLGPKEECPLPSR